MQKIILIGKPNVGKSSLFNKIIKKRLAITSDIAGTTRDTNQAQCEILSKKALLIDSGGLDESNELFKTVQANTFKRARSADIILYLVDGKKLPDEEDKAFFYKLKKLKKPMALVINKVDNKKDEERAWEFVNFGLKEVFASGIIIRELNETFSNFRAKESLSTYLKKHGKIGICELDTRYLVKLIRDEGNLRAIISTELSNKEELKVKLEQSARIEEQNLVALVSTKKVYTHEQGAWNAYAQSYELPQNAGKKVAVIDYGVKKNILNELVSVGLEVKVFPCNVKAEELILLFEKKEINGVFLSNGPGEPKILKREIEQIKKLAEAKVPMLGICLGHQLLSNAFGYETYKMKFGQHGANHPVLNLQDKKVEITAQNHNYNVPEELCQVAIITHRNLFGDNVEGVRYKEFPIISVQHHPESSSGPHESKYIFKEFVNLM